MTSNQVEQMGDVHRAVAAGNSGDWTAFNNANNSYYTRCCSYMQRGVMAYASISKPSRKCWTPGLAGTPLLCSGSEFLFFSILLSYSSLSVFLSSLPPDNQSVVRLSISTLVCKPLKAFYIPWPGTISLGGTYTNQMACTSMLLFQQPKNRQRLITIFSCRGRVLALLCEQVSTSSMNVLQSQAALLCVLRPTWLMWPSACMVVRLSHSKKVLLHTIQVCN